MVVIVFYFLLVTLLNVMCLVIARALIQDLILVFSGFVKRVFFEG